MLEVVVLTIYLRQTSYSNRATGYRIHSATALQNTYNNKNISMTLFRTITRLKTLNTCGQIVDTVNLSMFNN